ncbi:MAG: ATP-dependent RecD-like DNA helicase [Candidatus Izemoplasmatales bacterium]
MGYVEGSLITTLFHNEENLYSVLKIDISDTDEALLLYDKPTLIVCGFFPHLERNQTYRFHGVIKEHPKYGRQYDANRFERMIDKSKEGLIEYLSSDLFKGIGVKTAEAIIDTLGETAIDQILNDPSILDKVPKMNESKKLALVDTLRENRQMETSLVWLYGFQVSPKMAMKIIKRFGFAAIDVIKDNPYILMDEIEGIGFRRADDIALKIGIEHNHPLRLRAIVLFLMNEYMNKYGDTLLARENLIDFVLQYLNNGEHPEVTQEEVQDAISDALEEGIVIEEDNALSLTYLYDAERAISKSLQPWIDATNEEFSESEILAAMDDFRQVSQIEYTEEQKKAVFAALTKRFVIVTGGPGTGKTTVINAIVSVLKMLAPRKKNIFLTAPTGKAAKRLQEACGMEATTIHRFLGYDYEGHFTVDKHHPMDVDLLVVDEASMLDAMLAKNLFEGIRSKGSVVIVGDENQLPSVGPGQVLADLMESEMFDVVRLERIHRQAQDSSIIALAYEVLSQQVSDLSEYRDDRMFVRCYDDKIEQTLVTMIQEAIRKGYDLWEDIQILIPVYKGIVGIDHINKLLQETFNKAHSGHRIAFGEKTFYYHDKVLQLANQPEDGVMNGDIGVVAGIVENKEMLVDFSGKLVKYSTKDFDNLTLAYAISVHKSQGSEFPMVIMPISRSHAMMLRRKLIYTAITRAKERLLLLGDEYAFSRGVRMADNPRKTRLCGFLKQSQSQETRQELRIEDFL